MIGRMFRLCARWCALDARTRQAVQREVIGRLRAASFHPERLGGRRVVHRYASSMTDDPTTSSATAPDQGAVALALAGAPAAVRPCTRCEAEQHLVAHGGGLGKYRCLGCDLVVGFDLEADPAEFLLDRGSPSRYTRELFGSRLLPAELRIP